MPQASERLRKRMEEMFGDAVDDSGPYKFLKDAGYVEELFCWHPKSGVSAWSDMTQDEYDCVAFLIEEWDWGGLILPENAA